MKQNLEIIGFWPQSNTITIDYKNDTGEDCITINRLMYNNWINRTGRFIEDYWQQLGEKVFPDLQSYLLQYKAKEVLPELNVLDIDEDLN